MDGYDDSDDLHRLLPWVHPSGDHRGQRDDANTMDNLSLVWRLKVTLGELVEIGTPAAYEKDDDEEVEEYEGYD